MIDCLLGNLYHSLSLFSRRQIGDFIFLQKTGFDISCKLFKGDNLHEMAKHVCGKNKENIPECCLLKFFDPAF